LPAKIEEGFRSVSLVEVKWSKPLSVDLEHRFIRSVGRRVG
jgi:hypothetical protein